MATITFDALKFVDRLTAAGVPEQQAKAEAQALQEALTTSEVATTRDIERMEAKLDKELAPIRADLAVLKWMMGVLLAGVLSLVLKAFFA